MIKGFKKIKLTQGKYAIVDTEDYEGLSLLKWHTRDTGCGLYAVTGIWHKDLKRNLFLRMHRIIMKANKGIQVDHINGNSLDNRKSNIRLCTNMENAQNTKLRSDNNSGYKGVGWHNSNNKWRSRIKVNGKEKLLGYFSNVKEAAKAYDSAAKIYFTVSRRNFI